jgi:hypothetical protein
VHFALSCTVQIFVYIQLFKLYKVHFALKLAINIAIQTLSTHKSENGTKYENSRPYVKTKHGRNNLKTKY